MEYNKKCISSRFLKLTYPTFKGHDNPGLNEKMNNNHGLHTPGDMYTKGYEIQHSSSSADVEKLRQQLDKQLVSSTQHNQPVSHAGMKLLISQSHV